MASLQSLQSFATEIIVIDTGSTDRTVELAKNMGAQVFSIPWTDNFSTARNAAIEKATQRNILMVDADEQFDLSGASALAAFCQRSDRVAGRVQIRNVLEEGKTTAGEIVRIFPNHPDFRYQGRIHEQLLHCGETPQSVSTGITLVHTGYLQSAILQAGKIERNMRLLQLDQKEAPNDPYIAYQIGKTHYVAKEYPEAVEAFRTAVHLLGERGADNPPYLPALLSQFAYALLYLKQFSALFQVVSTGIDLYPDFTDLYFVYGLALIEQGDADKLQEIQEVFQHCLRLGEPDPNRYETVLGVGTFRAQYNLGVLYEVLGDRTQALQQYRLAADYGFSQAEERYRILQQGEG